jgi:DNA repair and recombination RAD54-like protein
MRRSQTPSFRKTPDGQPAGSPLLKRRRASSRPKRAAATGVQYSSMLGRGGGSDDDDDDDSDMEFASSQEGDVNAYQVENGSIVVHRAPVLACLNVPPEVVLKRQFKPPIPAGWYMPPEECGLGSGANKGKKSLGVNGSKCPPSSIGEYRAISLDELAAAMEEEEKVPGYDPCVLWEPPEETTLTTTTSSTITTTLSSTTTAIIPTTAITATSKRPKPVIVSPFIGKCLREHQREGVRFMFECVNGLRPYNGQGCILADDMGLGKTLQSITLMYTLLRKGIHGKPTAQRVIVVCPTSLVKNWANEIVKWLSNRVRSVALADADRKTAIKLIRRFIAGAWEVMIISYETFRIHSQLFEADEACDLLICDEAHRLKNDATLTAQALDKLKCKRRVLLSGTPMQNDLEEFYAMVNFCNPSVLGDVNQFRKRFQNPILRGREPDASPREVNTSNERSQELSDLVNLFILRRTNTLNAKFLPPKLTQIVCVSMTDMQRNMYEHVAAMARPDLEAEKKKGPGGGATALNAINAMKKICNHPQLMYRSERKFLGPTDGKKSGASGEDFIAESLTHFFPKGFGDGGHAGHRTSKRLQSSSTREVMDDIDIDDYDGNSGCSVHSPNPHFSGKFLLIANMLSIMRKETTDRIVIVSNYTQTLDVFELLCNEEKYPFVRLDGSTNGKKRQTLVDRLNNPKDDVFVFLLSSKAGGCGLNLIGANRLVLFDPDWNPATDKQAAARIWREGQQKRSYIYRFVATGSIEEKIYQRQLSKEGLQGVIADDKDLESALSTAQLKALFTYRHGLVCDTHDLYKCERCNPLKLSAYSRYRIELGDPVVAFNKNDKFVFKRELPSIAATTITTTTSSSSSGKFVVPTRLVESNNTAGVNTDGKIPIPSTAPKNDHPLIPSRDHPTLLPDAFQVGYPDEGDLNEWSHHLGVETCDDYVLRKAGGCLVSFVYGKVDDPDGLIAQDTVKAAKDKNKKEAAAAMAATVAAETAAMEKEKALKKVNKKNNTSSTSTTPSMELVTTDDGDGQQENHHGDNNNNINNDDDDDPSSAMMFVDGNTRVMESSDDDDDEFENNGNNS